MVRIPAKSAKVFFTFNVNGTRISSARLKANSYYSPIVFSKSTTPLEFRNRICVYKEGCTPSYYDMNFYIKGIGNVKSISGMANPIRFYIPYSSKLKKTDYNDELLDTSRKSSSSTNSGQFVVTQSSQQAKNINSETTESVNYYNRRIDKATTKEELGIIKKEIEIDVQNGKITKETANILYLQIDELLASLK